jgi:hypothetical protein
MRRTSPCFLLIQRLAVLQIFNWFSFISSAGFLFLLFYIYCDMSTRCWVAQQRLRNRSLLGSRSVNKIFRADATTSRNSIGIRFLRNMPRWRHPTTGVGEYRVTCFLRVRRLRNTKQAALSACTIENFIRGTGMSKKLVCKEQSYESVLRVSAKQ